MEGGWASPAHSRRAKDVADVVSNVENNSETFRAAKRLARLVKKGDQQARGLLDDILRDAGADDNLVRKAANRFLSDYGTTHITMCVCCKRFGEHEDEIVQDGRWMICPQCLQQQ